MHRPPHHLRRRLRDGPACPATLHRQRARLVATPTRRRHAPDPLRGARPPCFDLPAMRRVPRPPHAVARTLASVAAVLRSLAALLVLLASATSPDAAALPYEVRAAVDDVLACERPDGGWTYVCDPPDGPHGAVTRIVVRATQIAGWFGRDDWDLLVVRSPGTPAAGRLLLAAYRHSGDDRYLAAARRAGDVLLATQLSSGGWASEMPLHGTRLTWWFRLLNRWTALDDDVTSGGARFLAELWAATGDVKYRDGADRAFDLLLAAQLDVGAWPLTWRVPRLLATWSPSFEELPSTNDAATAGPIEALLDGARLLGRDDLRAAARRGGDWLLSVQGPPGRAGWAQQYTLDGKPAPGRRFEPAGWASWESREMLDALRALAREPDGARYCAAFPAAVEWLVASPIAPGCWARLYDIEDGRPLFVARDGRRVASPAEAKRPYKWAGDFGIPGLLGTLGLDTHGAPLAPEAPRPPRRIFGDAGRCPEDERANDDDPPNPRARIARAARLLAALDDPPPSPCVVAAR